MAINFLLQSVYSVNSRALARSRRTCAGSSTSLPTFQKGSNTKLSCSGCTGHCQWEPHFRGSERLWGALGLLIALCTELQELSCPLEVTLHLLAAVPAPTLAPGLAAGKEEHPKHIFVPRILHLCGILAGCREWLLQSWCLKSQHWRQKYKNLQEKIWSSKTTHCAAWLSAAKTHVCVQGRRESGFELNWISPWHPAAKLKNKLFTKAYSWRSPAGLQTRPLPRCVLSKAQFDGTLLSRGNKLIFLLWN